MQLPSRFILPFFSDAALLLLPRRRYYYKEPHSARRYDMSLRDAALPLLR